VDASVEPSNIIWENRNNTKHKIRVRATIVFIATGCLLALAFVLFYILKTALLEF
jgi:hypothetical protein